MTHRHLLALAGLGGFFGVLAGAFGAHALRATLSVAALGWWETGTFYLLIHSVAALACAVATGLPLLRAGFLLMIGALIFSVSLYGLALGLPRILGAVTPIGGVVMLLGWGDIIYGAARAR
ncbi:MAG: DUF423 domain-containing protein [Pseudomonadota bacterium]